MTNGARLRQVFANPDINSALKNIDSAPLNELVDRVVRGEEDELVAAILTIAAHYLACTDAERMLLNQAAQLRIMIRLFVPQNDETAATNGSAA